jgi:integrase
VVKELGALKHAFNLAIREWEWCKDNPVTRVSMPPLPSGRTRFLSEDEFNQILSNAEWFKPVLLIAVHTGMREGNLMSLRWDEVNLEKRVIILTKTKNKAPVAIPINDSLMAV